MKKFSGISLVILALLFLAVTLFWLSGRAGRAFGADFQPTLSPDLAQIATLQAALDSGQGDSLVRRSLEEKLEMAVRIATQKAQALQVTPEVEIQQVMTPYPTPLFETVLFEGSEGLIQPSVADVQNGWQGVIDGTRLQMFAGADAADARQGVLILITFDAITGGRSMAVLPALQPQGWLRIVSVEDGIFEPVSQVGATLYFDFRTLEYSD